MHQFSVRMIFLLLFIPIGIPVMFAQTGTRKNIRTGNQAYEKGSYKKAEGYYRKALGKDSKSLPGNYNLGGALYKQKKYDEAYDHYRNAIDQKKDSLTQSMVAYNFGNAALQRYLHPDSASNKDRGKFLQQSIHAYSQALRYNPDDQDARYNLSKALMLRHRQQQQPPQQKPEEQQEQDKKKQEQPLPETKKHEEKKKQEQPRQDKTRISKEDAERILNAIKEKELETAAQINERERKRNTSGKLQDW